MVMNGIGMMDVGSCWLKMASTIGPALNSLESRGSDASPFDALVPGCSYATGNAATGEAASGGTPDRSSDPCWWTTQHGYGPPSWFKSLGSEEGNPDKHVHSPECPLNDGLSEPIAEGSDTTAKAEYVQCLRTFCEAAVQLNRYRDNWRGRKDFELKFGLENPMSDKQLWVVFELRSKSEHEPTLGSQEDISEIPLDTPTPDRKTSNPDQGSEMHFSDMHLDKGLEMHF